ncbi:hypothetical protein BDV59DRAFT_201487 [Aspergillus ambiguus]|uniref:uncharacterized protein n=1 Tax=Aspergillus ambiguus TaxID=176160 RepID=UPI003CCC9D19
MVLSLSVLFLLYASQGVVAGLIGATLPLALKRYVSYSQVGLFSIAFYPYSVKALWSPLIDATGQGRRKRWISLSMMVSGLGLLLLALRMPSFVQIIVQGDPPSVVLTIGLLLLVVLASATQGAAADGWALTLFPPTHLHYVSTAHNLGLVVGEFGSYTGFLWLSSATSRERQRQEALLSAFVFFWSVFMLSVVLPCVVATTDVASRLKPKSISSSYMKAVGLLRLRPVQTIIAVHLCSWIPFEAHDTATNLKLLGLGFGEARLAWVSVIDFVFDLLTTYLAGMLCSRMEPLELWCWAFAGRTAFVMFSQAVLFTYSRESSWSTALVILEHAGSTSTGTIMFVAFLTFHFRVADPDVGSTYMTLLATAQNLGKTVPRPLVMFLVDYTTVTACDPVAVPGRLAQSLQSRSCRISVDGFYVVSSLSVVIGSLLFVFYLRPAVLALQRAPLAAWNSF